MTDKMIKQDHIVDDGEVIASYRTHPDIVRDGKRVMGLLLGFPAQHRVEHIFTETSVAAIRDALTTWLDAPRLAARATPINVASHGGVDLLRTAAGEWAVVYAPGEAIVWTSDEHEACREFATESMTIRCESCARFIDHADACVDEDGIYTCVDETACSAAIAALEAL
jgi:hypothetical protein